MVLEKPIVPYLEWLVTHGPAFLVVLLSVLLVGIFFGYLAAAMRHGPVEAFKATVRTLVGGLVDLAHLSPRRVYAMARLSFQESIRRRVLVVFVVFVVALLFAGWFLDPGSTHPARLYIDFVLTSTNYLVLVLAIFLSAFSLPSDVKNKTIFTIVTKPVRAWEIVLGRIIGFTAIGTLLLILMGIFSFVFVNRGLRHTHNINALELTAESFQEGDRRWTEQRGETSLTRQHRHPIVIRDEGITVGSTHDHIHYVTSTEEQIEKQDFRLGPPSGHLLARVPIRGTLRYLDPSGSAGAGINVGYENKYRMYIEGGTLAAAVWRFEGLRPEDFKDGLPLEMTLRVFRTHKGIIEQGITGTIQLVKPAPIGPDGRPMGSDGGLRSLEMSFTPLDHGIYKRFIDREIEVRDAMGNESTVDIFEELVDPETGALEVWIRCLDRGQYLGMAEADLYLRASNQPFWVNFIKGYTSIWFQMVVVTCFGVTFSTFLSGAVAMMATLAAITTGFFKAFVFDVASGDLPGGGPLESLVRLVDQSSQTQELDPGVGIWILQRIDDVLMAIIQVVSYAMPNCSVFSTSRFVAYGFDIPLSLMAQHFTITMAYALVVSAVGYFCFKTREIAA